MELIVKLPRHIHTSASGKNETCENEMREKGRGNTNPFKSKFNQNYTNHIKTNVHCFMFIQHNFLLKGQHLIKRCVE